MREITKKQRERYLKDPTHCPKCKSIDITADHIESDGSEMAWRNVECRVCGAIWQDVYELKDVGLIV